MKVHTAIIKLGSLIHAKYKDGDPMMKALNDLIDAERQERQRLDLLRKKATEIVNEL